MICTIGAAERCIAPAALRPERGYSKKHWTVPVLGKRAIDACGMQPPEGPGTNIDQAQLITPSRRLLWPNRYSSRVRPVLLALR